MRKRLIPPDIKRCQADRPNGATAFTLGGVPALVRCRNVPKFIIKESNPNPKDGLRGEMGVCAECLKVAKKQLPANHFKVRVIK